MQHGYRLKPLYHENVLNKILCHANTINAARDRKIRCDTLELIGCIFYGVVKNASKHGKIIGKRSDIK